MHFATFLAPIINDSFMQRPSSGPAFVQMTSRLFDEVVRNAKASLRWARVSITVIGMFLVKSEVALAHYRGT
jgi:hypothetical protein